MSLRRRLSLRCLLWAVSLSGCAGVTVPEGRQVAAHSGHDLVIDNHSSSSLAVHHRIAASSLAGRSCPARAPASARPLHRSG